MPLASTRFVLAITLLVSGLLLGGCNGKGKIDPEVYNAFEAVGLVQGTHYTVLKKPLINVPMPETADTSVIEFFWYGCGHCFKFEEPLYHWKKTLPANVAFKKIPAMWSDSMTLHAKAFYTAEFLGQEQINAQLFPLIMSFRTINDDLPQQTERLKLMFSGFYFGGKEFDQHWNSEAMQTNIAQAEQWQAQADIQATPSIIVDGRYLLDNKALGDPSGVLQAASKMIDALLMLKQTQAI